MISKDEKNHLVKAAIKALKTGSELKNKANYCAAVLTKKGNIYEGISYFSDTYTLTLHGEQAALSHALSHGEEELEAIAIASNEIKENGKFTNPCSMCKQLLYETSKRSNLDLEIILVNNHGETKELMLSEIVSHPWPED